jgi:ATP-dependent Clp protease ATP-binding subunit ClpB
VIVELQLERVKRWLADRRIFISFTPAAEDLIAEEGFDPLFGARPLKRAIQRLVQNPLAMKVLNGEFDEGTAVEVDREREQLVFRKTNAAVAVA